MNKWSAGLLAGFIATLVASLLMMMKAAMGMVPEFNAIAGNAQIFNRIGLGGSPAWGWIWHFVIGTVGWGLLYAALVDKLPGGGAAVKGLVFGLIVWLFMMIIWMPLAGHGFFAMPEPGPMAMGLALMVHLVFGLVLGPVYARFAGSGGNSDSGDASAGGGPEQAA